MYSFLLNHARSHFAVVSLLSALALAGCATPRRVALPPTLPEVGSASTVAALTKREIGTDIVRSNASDGLGASAGLIGGLIGGVIDASVNSSRAKAVESAVGPVRDALLKFDLVGALSESLRQELVAVPWLQNQTVEVREVSDSKAAANLPKDIKADLVLLVDTSYHLSPSFDQIVVSARVSVHPHGKALTSFAQDKDGLPKLIYLNYISSSWGAEGCSPQAGLTNNAAHWAAEDGKAAKAALASGLRELALLIAYDLAQPARPENRLYKRPVNAKVRTVSSVPSNLVIQRVDGYVEKKEGIRDWVRLPAGELCAFP